LATEKQGAKKGTEGRTLMAGKVLAAGRGQASVWIREFSKFSVTGNPHRSCKKKIIRFGRALGEQHRKGKDL
jgi:hypothetical protein